MGKLAVIGILLLMLLVAGGMCLCIKKRKIRCMFWMLAIVVIIVTLLGGLYFPTYQNYAFSLNEDIHAGETTISFHAPIFCRLHGGYDIYVEALDSHARSFEVTGYVEPDTGSGRFPFRGASRDTGQPQVTLGVNISEPIKNGRIFVDIKTPTDDVRYRFSMGRRFP